MVVKKTKATGIGLILLAGAGIATYFLLGKKKGFVIIKVLDIPKFVSPGDTISFTVFGENKEKGSQNCFIKIIDRETQQTLAPIQTYAVQGEASYQFTFNFIMPDKILDLEVQAGRIIDTSEKIDDRKGFTIKPLRLKTEIVEWYLTK